MALPIIIVVVTSPIPPVADVDAIAQVMLVVLAGGIVGWCLWRRK